MRASIGARESHGRALEIREQVLRGTLWIDPDSITVEVGRGVVRLGGTADRRSTAQIAARLCRTVGGVVDVIDEIRYEYDDTAELGPDIAGARVWKATT